MKFYFVKFQAFFFYTFFCHINYQNDKLKTFSDTSMERPGKVLVRIYQSLALGVFGLLKDFPRARIFDQVLALDLFGFLALGFFKFPDATSTSHKSKKII